MSANFTSKVNAFAIKGQPFFFIVDFDKQRPQVFGMDELPENIWFSLPAKTMQQKALFELKDFRLESFPPSFVDYKKAFEQVKKEINHGNSYLLNLTFKSRFDTNFTLEEIYHRSRAKYKLYFQDRFVVFSPETFVQIQGGIISCCPMKGTMDAFIDNAEQLLLDDPKETAEHNTIVDLIRNDLAMVSEDVFVEKFKYIEKIKTHKGELLQMSSKISGVLPESYRESLGEMLLKLLPAGSISGAPKKKTVEIIKGAEDYQRGYYTGIFGYFDGENLDSAVMIRFIEKENGQLFFKSGGGITSMSDPVKEYEELIQKIYVPLA
jgi:para-aminobenzoate synthetase component 1